MKKQRDWCPAVLMDSEDRLFIMYTSGTSDPSPTGIVHSQAGYLLYVAMTHQVLPCMTGLYTFILIHYTAKLMGEATKCTIFAA